MQKKQIFNLQTKKYFLLNEKLYKERGLWNFSY